MKNRPTLKIMIISIAAAALFYTGGYFFIRGVAGNYGDTAKIAALGALPIAVLAILSGAAVAVYWNKRYNAFLLPMDEIKDGLHKISTGAFVKVAIDKKNKEMLEVINEINDIAAYINRLNKIRSNFFANASHELNTPLTCIAGFAELMENGFISRPEAVKEYGAKIRKDAERMGMLVKDMLKISALENPDEELKPELVQVSAVLNSAIETIAPIARSNNVTIRSFCSVDTVQSREKLIYDILINLIQNAVRYNKDGGYVSVMIKKPEAHIEIAVEDNGIGIAEEHQTRIFERFYRVDKSRSREKGGTGLGLAIVKHSAEKLGGTVSVESEIGKGTTFTVKIPANQNRLLTECSL